MYELRKILEKYNLENKDILSKNHRKRFQSKLNRSLHKSAIIRSLAFKIAASILVLISLFFYFNTDISINNEETLTVSTNLNIISPELGKIETYYTAAINYELSNIPLESNNK